MQHIDMYQQLITFILLALIRLYGLIFLLWLKTNLVYTMIARMCVEAGLASPFLATSVFSRCLGQGVSTIPGISVFSKG